MSITSSSRLLTVAAIVLLTGCGGAGAPKAPSGLIVGLLSGGGHLTWTDNSDNETEFLIERMTAGGAFAMLASVPFNTTAYHDGSVVVGMTYTYRVAAMNAGGMSSPSNEEMLTAPDSVDMAKPSDMNMGSDTCHAVGCRAYSSYCSTAACACVAVISDNPDPSCTGTTVNCAVDPCAGKTASCNHGTGACAVQ